MRDRKLFLSLSSFQRGGRGRERLTIEGEKDDYGAQCGRDSSDPTAPLVSLGEGTEKREGEGRDEGERARQER